MNISTSNSTSTETNQVQTNNNEIQQPQKAEKTSDAIKTEEKKNENKESQSEFKKMLDEAKSVEKTDVEKQLQEGQNPQNIQQVNQQFVDKFGFDTVSSIKNIKSSFHYDTIKISKDDAKFFADLVENKQFVMQQSGEKTTLIKFADEIGPTYKSQQTSQVLTDLISKAYNEQKPVRIDFDNNVSVILKVDTKGKVSAEFIPGDKAVEAYLRNNIGFLKQRFDDQNLPYNDLLYRQSNNGNQNKERQNQQRNKGE